MLIVVCKTSTTGKSAYRFPISVHAFIARTSDAEREAVVAFIRERAKRQYHDAYTVFKALPADGTFPTDNGACSQMGAQMAEYDVNGIVVWCDGLQTEADWQI